MSTTNIFTPYLESTGHENTGGTKTRFVSLFTDNLFNLLADDEGVVALGRFSQKTGGLAVGQLLDSIRQSIRIQVQQGNVESRQQLRISVNGIQLRDRLTDLLDNNVVAETRNPDSQIGFLKELLNAKDNVCIAFQIALTGKIFDLQNLNASPNKKGSWISRQIITAIEQAGELMTGEHMEI